MKKLLLTIGLAALACGSTFAQNPFILFDGTDMGFLSSSFYKFDGISLVKDSAMIGTSDKFLYLSGTAASYYAGGVGNAAYSGPNTKVPLTYTGKVASTTFGFTANTYTSATVKVKVQLKTPTTLFGYEFDLATAAAGPTPFTVALGDFKKIINDNPIGDAIADSNLAMVNEFQFVFTCTDNLGKCTFNAGLDNVVLVDGSGALGLNEDALFVSDETVSAYDMLGNFVGTGKIKELGLESGKVYIVKSASKTRKIVMAK